MNFFDNYWLTLKVQMVANNFELFYKTQIVIWITCGILTFFYVVKITLRASLFERICCVAGHSQ